MSFKKFAVATVAASAVVVALAGCANSGSSASSSGAAASGEKICVYTHGDGGTFWSVFQKGSEAAAETLGVTLDYQGTNNDAAKQAQAIEAGIAGGCKAISVSAPNPDAIKDALAKAEAAGIPVLTTNSGAKDYAALGAYTHVGQDEVIAGEEAGKKFNDLGLKSVLCVIQEADNQGLAERCQGLKNTFKGTVVELNADGALKNPQQAQSQIAAALTANPNVDGIFTLNADVATGSAIPAIPAGKNITVGTVDLSKDALQAIKDGKLAFAVDQQQYAQGYLAVLLQYLALTNGNLLGGGQPVYTGPGFVTKENVDDVITYTANGTR